MSCDKQDASFHAKALMALSPEIEQVLLFGTVARDGIGNDLDIVLIIPEGMFQLFGKSLRWGYMLPEDRRITIASILGLSSDYAKSEQLINETRLDLWLLPANWMDRTEEIQDMMPKLDAGLIGNIKMDYIVLETRRESIASH